MSPVATVDPFHRKDASEVTFPPPPRTALLLSLAHWALGLPLRGSALPPPSVPCPDLCPLSKQRCLCPIPLPLAPGGQRVS